MSFYHVTIFLEYERITEYLLEGFPTADKLKEHLHKLAEEEILDMKINLTNLDYIDSTGLGVMIGVLKKLKISHKEIYIINPKSNVKKIFTITGLDKIFKVEG